MVDLATLKGLHPKLARTPAFLYFHENQFAYPVSGEGQSKTLLEAKMVQVYSALAADCIGFNSEFNRRSFVNGVEDLLARFPDKVPKGVLSQIEEKSIVLPVGIKSGAPGSEHNELKPRGDDVTRHLIWNHRWEYDKGPERLLAFVQKLSPQLMLEFHVVGQSFRSVPPEFEALHALLAKRGWLGQWGYIESRQEYTKLLSRADYVLSTAIHDFQGISVLEACASGCIPVLPKRMVYPEIFDEHYLYDDSESVEIESSSMAAFFESLCGGRTLSVPDVRAWNWPQLSPRYRQVFDSMLKAANQ